MVDSIHLLRLVIGILEGDRGDLVAGYELVLSYVKSDRADYCYNLVILRTGKRASKLMLFLLQTSLTSFAAAIAQ